MHISSASRPDVSRHMLLVLVMVVFGWLKTMFGHICGGQSGRLAWARKRFIRLCSAVAVLEGRAGWES